MDDAKLLIGVYEHGLGNWENIRDDPSLGFSKKVCTCVCVCVCVGGGERRYQHTVMVGFIPPDSSSGEVEEAPGIPSAD